MWQYLGALFMVTMGCGKLLSSEQKLGLLSTILQDTDHPPMATNYPVHEVNCADIGKVFSVKDDFCVLWQKKMRTIFVKEKAGRFYLHFASWKTKTLRCGNGATSPDWWFINLPLFAHITLRYGVSFGASTSALEGRKSYPNAQATAFPDFVSRKSSTINSVSSS